MAIQTAELIKQNEVHKQALHIEDLNRAFAEITRDLDDLINIKLTITETGKTEVKTRTLKYYLRMVREGESFNNCQIYALDMMDDLFYELFELLSHAGHIYTAATKHIEDTRTLSEIEYRSDKLRRWAKVCQQSSYILEAFELYR